jgi:TatA/E family protein of Tat protein translocase
MFGSLGGPEVILILVVALIVFGPRRLPEIGKSMGKMLAEFRKASNDFKRTIEDELEAEKAKDTYVAPVAAVEPAPPPPVTEESSMTPAPVVAAPGVPEMGDAPPPVVAPHAEAYEPRVEPPAEVVVSRGPAADEK